MKLKIFIIVTCVLHTIASQKITPQIVGGGNAPIGSASYQVSLQKINLPTLDILPAHYCGGAIINPFWIVTGWWTLSCNLIPAHSIQK